MNWFLRQWRKLVRLWNSTVNIHVTATASLDHEDDTASETADPGESNLQTLLSDTLTAQGFPEAEIFMYASILAQMVESNIAEGTLSGGFDVFTYPHGSLRLTYAITGEGNFIDVTYTALGEEAVRNAPTLTTDDLAALLAVSGASEEEIADILSIANGGSDDSGGEGDGETETSSGTSETDTDTDTTTADA